MLKHLVAAALAVPTVYVAFVLVHALATTSPIDSVARMLGSPWALSGLVDYSAGLLFSVPYLWLRASTLPAKIGLALGAIVLGNAFSVAVFIWLILSSDSTLRAAVLPVRTAFPPIDSTSASRRTFIGLALLAFLGYLGLLVYCVQAQPLATGWATIQGDAWAYATFVNVWTGQCLVLTYILVREGRDAKLFAAALSVGLVIVGNLATCYYLLHLFVLRFPGWHVRDVLLWNDNDANVDEDAPLLPKTSYV
ncbi:hypothetical protein SPRG_20473 [Saprolegnia parasitica CBS 223.65]|uniref:Uncharacterized protein n=1 Tax=Saprolegnia parasitica (strain CBS 223.65) TaxID=695850 RepID=A0A067C7F4_SAPPC|nr:hypothetical protein SPRG_20473 [Saprolegnia parasitica CBS 223.65]KDO26669.1 hypothetical protein SPRG_20473 [Saprolegnia parasitica CBS 223.65]|eukprot:XP_012202567.1 hypothetical protein SPRG_20473 [Saprolegnia parasitica CBS 223.65]